MNQKRKFKLAKKVKDFCMNDLNLSEQETYDVVNRIRYELYHKKVKIKQKELLNSESKQEIKNWEKI